MSTSRGDGLGIGNSCNSSTEAGPNLSIAAACIVYGRAVGLCLDLRLGVMVDFCLVGRLRTERGWTPHAQSVDARIDQDRRDGLPSRPTPGDHSPYDSPSCCEPDLAR